MIALAVDDLRDFTPEDAGSQEVVHVRNSRDAIAHLDSRRYDVLLLDWSLGHGNTDRWDRADPIVEHICSNVERFRDLHVKIVTDYDDHAATMCRAFTEAGISCEVTDLGHRWNEARMRSIKPARDVSGPLPKRPSRQPEPLEAAPPRS